MKILIDNNIITDENIVKINNSNIFEQIDKNKMEFFASAKLFNQLVPYLIKTYDKEGYKKLTETINFIFKLTGKSRCFDSCQNISQKELKKARGKIQYISCAMQNKITPDKFADINILKQCEKYLSKDFSFDDIKKAREEILSYEKKNFELIENYKKQSFDKIEVNIKQILEPYKFGSREEQAAINIVTNNVINQSLTKEEKKDIIYKNLFYLLQEFNLLLQLREQNKLIKDNSFFKNYYPNYFQQSFTKIMIDSMLFGYSYKVINNQKRYDDDWPSDNCYVCCTYFTDILLTNDRGYIKDVFNHIYQNTKQILTLDEFLNKYC